MRNYLNIKQISIFILPLLLSSCAIYPTNFYCGDSKGAKCVMLSEVDRRIDSGESETVYLDKKCKSKDCKEINNVPKKALNQIHQVKIMPIENNVNEYQEDDYLYLK